MPLPKEGLLEYEGPYENGYSQRQPFRLQRYRRRFLDIVRPAIFTRSTGERRALRSTAYLDGIRGFAALLVYCGHHQLWARESIGISRKLESGYGFEGNFYFACLPVVRTFFSGGHMSVCLFFAISGYALSYKSIGLIQAGKFDKLTETISSSLVRRAPRLYTPVLATTFLYLTSWHLFGLWSPSPKQKDTYYEEVWNWATEFTDLTWIYRDCGPTWFTYNFHTWSIPVEYKGSLVVYMTLIGISRCSRDKRLLALAATIFYFLYLVNGGFVAIFISGILICDLELLAAKDNLPPFFKKLEPFKGTIMNFLFVAGLFLGGCPSATNELSDLQKTPGWYYLSMIKPRAQGDFKWFYLFWAAVFLLVSIPRIPPLRRFFETRFCQYLGKISYMFYLVHGPILWMIADRMYAATGWVRPDHIEHAPQWINKFPLSKAGPLGLDMAFLLPQLILLPLTFWTAEIAMKLIDEPSIKMSGWLYDWLIS